MQAAFDLLGIECIEAGAQADNASSFAVMQRIGMTKSHERMVFASARTRTELCVYYRITRTHFIDASRAM
jgi:RimJ/RimL family protein N-acetyltransferase